VRAVVEYEGVVHSVSGHGNGIMSAFCQALHDLTGISFDIINYSEHSMEYGSKSRAITYLQIRDPQGGIYFGAGVSSSISKSSLLSIVSAYNRMHTSGALASESTSASIKS